VRRGTVREGLILAAGVALFWLLPALAVVVLLAAVLRLGVIALHRLLRRLQDPRLGPHDGSSEGS
jgi:hypothetical protein